MAWTAPIRFVDGDPITAAQINTMFKDNLNATPPGIATRQGRLVVTAGKHELAERQPVKAYADGTVTSENDWPQDPQEEDESGPSVTFEHGGSFLALYSCRIRRTATGGFVNYAPVVEGQQDVMPEVYKYAVRMSGSTFERLGAHFYFKGFDPGITTVTMKYGRNSGETARGDYAQRALIVIPF